MANQIWILDDDQSIRWVLEQAFTQADFDVTAFDNGHTLLRQLETQQPQVVISDIRMPDIDGLQLLERVKTTHPGLPVIIMTAHSDLETTVASYQGGAFDYLPKPFDIDDALNQARRAIAENRATEPSTAPDQNTEQAIIGDAPAMQDVFRAIGRLSHSHATVLLTGASGTGKELVAQALHQHSPRAGKPFVALNMAAIPKDLIESELFGHEKGAFTGAASQRRGYFERADGGTLFLDEIGDMPAETQTRLLRVLAEGLFYRVGGHTQIKTDVRIIAATHQNLETLVREGQFREDLFHRLNVIRVHLPALKDRPTDIPQLARHFLVQSAKELQVEPKSLTKGSEDYLCGLAWAGNVRQLQNTCHWLNVMASGREIQVDDLPPELRQATASSQPSNQASCRGWESELRQWAAKALAKNQTGIALEVTQSVERTLIEAALLHTNGRKQDAAKLLGWGRNTLTRKIKELSEPLSQP